MQPTGYHAQTRWTSSLSNRLLVEAGFSVQYNKWRREQHDWHPEASSTYDLSTGTWGGGFWITGWQPEQSQYIKTSLSYVTGSHNIKAGVEHRWGTIGLDQPMHADVRTYYYDGVDPVGLQVLATPVGNYEGRINFDTGIFAQDSWTLGNWTLNLGTRADFFSSEVPPQSAPAGTWVPERSFPRYAGPRWNTIVARIGVAYDVFGDGRTAIKGTAHQYVSQESTRLALERNPMSSYTWSAAQEFRSWDDLDGNRSIVGPNGRVQYEEVGASPNVNFGTANDVIGLDLDGREGNWEYNASIQHELLPGISATFGWYGQLILIDEVFTPDSSRFWPKDEYKPGSSPPSFDKQYVRDYLSDIGWNKEPPVPELPAEVIRQTSEKYLEAYRLIVGRELL